MNHFNNTLLIGNVVKLTYSVYLVCFFQSVRWGAVHTQTAAGPQTARADTLSPVSRSLSLTTILYTFRIWSHIVTKNKTRLQRPKRHYDSSLTPNTPSPKYMPHGSVTVNAFDLIQNLNRHVAKHRRLYIYRCHVCKHDQKLSNVPARRFKAPRCHIHTRLNCR